jgi:hypothetical protein
LREYGDKRDLELFLVASLGQSEPAKEAEPLELEEEVAEAPPEAPAPEPVTLGRLCAALGEGVIVSPGLILQQDLQVGQTPVRFAARFEGGLTFTSKVIAPEGAIWAGQFSLADFPGIADFVAGLLGNASIAEPVPEMTDRFATSPILTSGQQHPVAGEVWVMNALVESDDGREVRYVGVDIDGQPFGAPRVLARETFREVFSEIKPGSFALRVEILRTSDDQVNYVQLDSKSKRMGEPRAARLNPFLSNFTPEAAAY